MEKPKSLAECIVEVRDESIKAAQIISLRQGGRPVPDELINVWLLAASVHRLAHVMDQIEDRKFMRE